MKTIVVTVVVFFALAATVALFLFALDGCRTVTIVERVPCSCQPKLELKPYDVLQQSALFEDFDSGDAGVR